MKKLLFITGKILPNSSQGVRYRNLLSYLSLKYDITLLSMNDFLGDELRLIKRCTLLKSTSNFSISENKLNIGLLRNLFSQLLKKIYGNILIKFIFPDRYILKIYHYRLVINSLLDQNNFSIAIIGMTPYSLYLLVPILKKRYGINKLVVDLSDPFIKNVGLKYPSFYKKHLVPNFEAYFLKNIDEIVVLNPTIKELYLNNYPKILQYDNVHIVEQGMDFSLQYNGESKNNSHEFSLIYAGSFHKTLRSPFHLYKALDSIDEFKIVLKIFGNIKKEFLPDLTSEKFLFFGAIKHEMLLEEYCDANVIVFLDNSSGYQVPGKILEILALKKPILFIYENEKSPTLKYTKDISSIVYCENNVQSIVEGIKIIFNKYDTFNFNYDVSMYSWKSLMKKYILLLEK